MKKDFDWLYKIIKHPGNNIRHVDSLYTLVDLFTKKWNHYESNSLYKEAYLQYVFYLRIAIKSLIY